ncbi:hypothetical protein DESUT3_20300 [Desulfuromonas versatilis]|uniref:Uncharacterized protein n=1 Tax=Desulfuromonas versatilis TaxID=2802975 RepID=A0ABM8HSK6_9BACT|nr:hypothetical protein [Desulfuromonas versatilis]BCR04961.1 hypothetical protein DESUT3_20300 [Desulfuromonas versatilis]
MSRLGTDHLLDGEGLPLFSLGEINRLDQAEKEKIYLQLIPGEVFDRFAIDPVSLCNAGGERVVRFVCPSGLGLLRIELRRSAADRDCLFFVELADTPYRQIELAFCIINDPDSPRFDIDVDLSGRDNCFGTLRRNLPEELKALGAGLSPNQVRRGLKLFSRFFSRLERFVDSLGIDAIVAEPLSYNNAIRYEKYGFDYITGKQLMLWIDREFQPGGLLYRRLDGSTPFRLRGMERTVRGRSWAIHDGVMEQAWDGVKIYKTIGVDAGIDTFPGRRF